MNEKSLVLFSSLLAYIEGPLISDYLASKHGVRGLFKSLCNGNYPFPIGDNVKLRVNSVAPTLVRSPMTEMFVNHLVDKGFAVADVKDAVDVATRLACDSSIHGKAVAVIPGGGLDLCDDAEGFDGSREARALLQNGKLGQGPKTAGCYPIA